MAHDQKYMHPQLCEDNVLMIKAGRCAISVLHKFQFHAWIWVVEVLAGIALLKITCGVQASSAGVYCNNTVVPNDTNIDQISGSLFLW